MTKKKYDCQIIYNCDPINSDCTICTINPDNDLKDLQKAGRSYTPVKR